MTPKSIFAAVLVFLPVPAFAQTMDASGAWIFTPASVPYPVAHNLVVIHVNNAYDRFEPAGPDHPAAGAAGQCFGAILINAGQASGRGNCHIVDGDGDAWVSEWIVEGIDADRMTTGRWAIIDGTGKYAGASGSGSFRAGADASGTYKNETTGEITLN